MIIFWIITLVVVVLVVRKEHNEFLGFLVILQLMFFILAIATKDPILPSSWNIDPYWEMTVEGIVASFTIWRTYLNPLKKKVYGMDREIGEIKTSMSNVEHNVDRITDKILNGKIKN